MTPYYQDSLVSIYHGDCREIEPELMRRYPHYSVVTDPPYGTGAYASDVSVLTGEMLNSWPKAAVFGWPEKLIALCIEAQRIPDEWVVWWPTNAELKGRFVQVPVARETEHIALFGKVREARGAPVVGQSHNYVGPNDRAKHHISPKGKRWGDVWRDASPSVAMANSQNRLHPNEKPVGLMRRLLGLAADGVILDPFMGSGTTLVAAKSLNRGAVGIEIEERYCETAAIRCRQEVLGLAL